MWQPRTGFNFICLLSAVLVFTLAGCETPQYEDYGLDVVALEMSPDNLSALANGVYTKTPVAATCTFGDITYAARVSYTGATVIDNYKKSYKVELDGFFKGRAMYRLNAMNGDPTGMRALLAHKVFEATGFSQPRLSPVAVYLNGDYQGLFLLQEPYDEAFYARSGQHPISVYKANKKRGTLKGTADLADSFSIRAGDSQMEDLAGLIEQVAAATGASDPAGARKLFTLIDSDQMLTYMSVTAFIHHVDGIDNNYHLVRTREQPAFVFMPWDLDCTFRDTYHYNARGLFFDRNALMYFLATDPIMNDGYRARLQETAARLPLQQLNEMADSIYSQIAAAYAHDPALQRDGHPLAAYLRALKQHFIDQHAALRDI